MPGFLATDLQSTGTVTILFPDAVTPVNGDPVGADDDFAIVTGNDLSGNVLDDNGNGADTDPDGDTMTPTLATGPANGTLAGGVINPDGSFTYTPNAGFTGTDTFTYDLSDGNSGTDGPITVTIEVTAPPVGQTFFGDTARNIFDGTVGLVDTVDYSSLGNAGNAIFVILTGPDGQDTVAAGGPAANPASNGDVFTSIENIIGTLGDDIIAGSSADIDNVFWGGGGSDGIEGGGGDDELFGGDGNDVLGGGEGTNLLDGGAGLDTASFFSSTTGIVFDMNTVLDANGDGTFGTNTLVSIEGVVGSGAQANTLTGNDANNRLFGGNAADVLVGNDGGDLILGFGGDDDITGGAGFDILNGGAGADTFFILANSGTDLIEDFENGIDLIDISGAGLAFADLTITQDGSDVDVTAASVPGLTIILENQVAGDIDSLDFV